MANRGFLVGTVAALAVALAILLASGAGPAEAAFPGENGKIAYQAGNILDWDLDFPEIDRADVWVAYPDGSGKANLTDTPGVDELHPAFSPDGESIAFVRGGDVWVMGADGTDQRNLFADDPNLRGGEPAWSPDGESIAFVRGGDIWAMRADGTGQGNLTNTPENNDFSPAWSPDGTRIAFVRFHLGMGGYDLWTMGADGTGQENLTGPFDEGGYDADEVSPDFSPDGKTLTFSAYVPSTCAQNIFAMDARGSAWTNLTRIPDQRCSGGGGEYAASPAYSPDGRRMAYVTGSYAGDVALMNSDGSGQGTHGFPTDPDPDDEYSHYAYSPDWQPVCPCPEVPPPDEGDTTAPTITHPTPVPGSEVGKRKPVIRATVRDAGGELAKADMRLRVDGETRGFFYNWETDRLMRSTERMRVGRHTVEVVAEDAAGNTATKRWSFRVVRR